MKENRAGEPKESKKALTPEQLRNYKGFEDVTDQQAEKIIHSIKEFSIILYQHYIQKKTIKKEEQHEEPGTVSEIRKKGYS